MPPCRVNLQCRDFLKRTNYQVTTLFLPYSYSQSDQTGILDVLEIKILAAQTWWAAFEDFF